MGTAHRLGFEGGAVVSSLLSTAYGQDRKGQVNGQR